MTNNIKVKIQDKMKKKVKNGGMHLLNNFVKTIGVSEIEIHNDEMFILNSDQFKHWFDLVSAPLKKNEEKPSEVGEGQTISELRDWCKCQGFKDYTQLKKSDLVKAIKEKKLEKK